MDPESLLLKEISQDELEELVENRIKEFHGFLSRDVALRLIAKEKGLIKKQEKFSTISEIEKSQKKINLRAKVTKVWPIASYSSGNRSRVINLCDDTGSIPLVLWNDDTDIGTSIRTGDLLLLSSAYERNNELHLGYAGQVEIIEKSDFARLDSLKENLPAHVRGFITKIHGFSDNGFCFSLSDGKNEINSRILFDLDRGRKLSISDEVILENVLFSKNELTITQDSRIMSRQPRNMLLGKIEKLEYMDNELSITVGGKQVLLDKENALRFFGVDVADDIKLETVATLKKDGLLNKNVAIKTSNQNGRLVITG